MSAVCYDLAAARRYRQAVALLLEPAVELLRRAPRDASEIARALKVQADMARAALAALERDGRVLPLAWAPGKWRLAA